MYRIALGLGIAVSVALCMAPSASAQPPAPSQQGPISRQPKSGSPQRSGMKEDFDQDPVTGWEFHGQHAFVSTGNGRALATKGAAFWVAAGEVTDFTIKFRYGYERGTALVDFRHAHRYGIPDRYVLLLGRTGVALIRVQHLPSEVQERELASASFSLTPQTWHDVIIQAAGGQINVWIDGKGVLSVRDPQPLRSGLCALGAERGVALYDNVILIPQGKADQGGLATNPATWPVSSGAKPTSQAGPTGSPSSPVAGSPVSPTASGKTPATILLP